MSYLCFSVDYFVRVLLPFQFFELEYDEQKTTQRNTYRTSGVVTVISVNGKVNKDEKHFLRFVFSKALCLWLTE